MTPSARQRRTPIASPSEEHATIEARHGSTAGDREVGEGLEIGPLEPRHDEERDAFVRASPNGTFFHLAQWRRFVEGLYGHRPAELGAWRDDELAAILPMMFCPGILGRPKLVSVPYSVYGGALARSSADERRVVDEACLMAERRGARYLELRYLDDPGLELPRSELYWTFLRDLPADPADVLTAMPKKSRAEARKARNRHGLELSEGRWYVDDLHRLFLLNKHVLGSPALPARHFHRLCSELRDDVFVHLVHRGKEPLAAVMSFAYGDTLIAYYAGTAPSADRNYSASNFMYMALQEWAVRRGFRVFDFSRSRGDSGAFRFKVHQGFEPRALHYRFHLVGNSKLPSFTPSNPKTALLRKSWSRLPLGVARRLSGRLSRYLA